MHASYRLSGTFPALADPAVPQCMPRLVEPEQSSTYLTCPLSGSPDLRASLATFVKLVFLGLCLFKPCSAMPCHVSARQTTPQCLPYINCLCAIIHLTFFNFSDDWPHQLGLHPKTQDRSRVSAFLNYSFSIRPNTDRIPLSHFNWRTGVPLYLFPTSIITPYCFPAPIGSHLPAILC